MKISPIINYQTHNIKTTPKYNTNLYSQKPDTFELSFGAKKSYQPITFTPAKTIEEAREYAQKVLKVPYCDLEDLECANHVNEGLTNLKNYYQGKCKMPVIFKNTTDDIAAMEAAALGPIWLILVNEKIQERKEIDYTSLISLTEEESFLKVHKSFGELFEKLKNGEELTLNEACALSKLRQNRDGILHAFGAFVYCDPKMLETARENGVDFPQNLDDFYALTPEEKNRLLYKIYLANDKNPHMPTQKRNDFSGIYHEMCHLIHKKALGRKEYFKNHVNNKTEEELENNVLNWVTRNPEEALMACCVTEYAISSPNEFVAETYANLLNGTKYPPAIMDLYKKYGGPKIPNSADFQLAKSIKEAKRYATEILKVPHFDLKDLECANYVNEGLTLYKKMYGDECIMPSIKRHSKEGDNSYMLSVSDESSATIYVNEKNMQSTKTDDYAILTDSSENDDFCKTHSSLEELIAKLKKGEKLTLKESCALSRLSSNKNGRLIAFSLLFYSQDNKYLKIAQNKGVKIPTKMYDFSTLELDEQKKLLKLAAIANGYPASIVSEKRNDFQTLFHELGHINHYKKIGEREFDKYLIDNSSRDNIITNVSKWFKENPKEAFLACQISAYSATSPIEFVANVYAGLLAGVKYNEEIMQMYKKYNGPEIPNLNINHQTSLEGHQLFS